VEIMIEHVITDLKSEIRCRLPYQAERRTDVNFQDNVKRLVWCCVKHLVKCKASFIGLSRGKTAKKISPPLLIIWLIFPNALCQV
jgi:hypothetical protein